MKSSSQCHNNPVLVPPRKPPDPVKDYYDGQIYDLKTSVDIWIRMDVVPVDYGIFAQTFNLKMWFFQFITGITFMWDYQFCPKTNTYQQINTTPNYIIPHEGNTSNKLKTTSSS